MTDGSEVAGIQYHGLAGVSRACQDAVLRLLQFGDEVTRVRILTCSNRHCLLLENSIGDLIAIKSGFASGYVGEGPRRFSFALQYLERFGAEIDEYGVDEAFIERLDQSALTKSDLEDLTKRQPIRPSRWYDYVLGEHDRRMDDGGLWSEFRPIIPFAVIDGRIIDLAITFWEDPDDKLLKAYRRLEDVVRERTGMAGHGSKLLSKAFAGDKAVLGWPDVDKGESAGRASLFTGAYLAYRNPRSHKEANSGAAEHLAEFLLLNHLFLLEKEARSVDIAT